MRNYVGAIGASEAIQAIVEALTAAGYHDVDVEYSERGKVIRITWESRLIVFDRTPTLRCGDHARHLQQY